MGKLKERKSRPTVYYPVEMENENFCGDIFGYHHADTNIFNITGFGEGAKNSRPCIGKVEENDAGHEKNGFGLSGRWMNGELVFYQGGQICRKRPYELLLNVFSRNSGILETDLMLNKTVVISGLGSVGSLVALELARSGLGNFLLIDNDILEYHNICRHQCSIEDVGKFKVSAVRERIMQINPNAVVRTETGILEETSKDLFDSMINSDTIMVGCADNREGDRYANRLATLYGIPFVSIGFWERAFAGEIFYGIPGQMPCYECLFSGTGREMSARVSQNRRFYTTEEDLSRTRFEPGISTDINFITTIGIKLLLDLFNRDTDSYIPRLLSHLAQFTLVCNTSDARIGGDQAEIFSYPLQVTRSIRFDYAEGCSVCGGKRTAVAG